MDPNRWKQIDALVDAALEVPENERDAFITSRADGDDDLRRAVAELVAAQGKSDGFLQHSAMKIVAKALAGDEPPVKSESLVNKTIATYRIEKLLGAGGMGEVYLAFDEKLKRNIALKILPAEYGMSDERVKRFEMEARAISSINHPNIVTIYDVGNFEGINYIATEFVEGKTLRDLIGGKFKMRNVMANSIQICDALSAAHAEGIIHRDIKPENIMIRKDGYAKILDFGVAKLTEVGPDTMSGFANTTKGILIGTPAYMSPAQVGGEGVDHRTDLWSSGVVLYEFITGKNPFKGVNRQMTFHAILSEDPPVCSSLNPDVPEDLDRIFFKLLEKEPGMGYQTAADLRSDLKRIKREMDSTPSGSYSGKSSRIVRAAGRRRWRWFAGGATFAALLLAAVASWGIFLRGRAQGGTEWSSATNIQLTDHAGTEFYPSLAPDGKSFVYASDASGNFDIYLQRVGGKNPTPLTKDSPESDVQPAFSPDGEQIAFRSERVPKGVYVMGASGENLRRVADFGFHPSWSPNGKEIVVSSFGRDQPSVREAGDHQLTIVDVETGSKRSLLNVQASFPAWSPGGKRIAYWFYTESFGRRDIATVSAAGGDPVIVAKGFAVSNWNPVWSPDGKFLYFVSSKGGSLNFWRVAIDENSGAVLSEPEPVVTPSKFSRHLNFSRDGKRMIYVQTNNQANLQGVELDSKSEKVVGEPFWITQGDREVIRAELSPDGTRFVMRLIRRTQDDIVTVSRDGQEWRDVTNDAPFDRYPRWSPDGKQIAFHSDRLGSDVWMSNADGTNLRQITFSNSSTGFAFPIWSPDGTRLIVGLDGQPYIVDLSKTWEQQEPRQQIPLTGTTTTFTTWDWSLDGKMLAGVVGEGPKRFMGIYSFETSQYTILADNGNFIPSWMPDSRRVVYGAGKTVFVVDIVTGKIRELLSIPTEQVRSPFVSRDGKLLYYMAVTAESDIWLLDNTQSR